MTTESHDDDLDGDDDLDEQQQDGSAAKRLRKQRNEFQEQARQEKERADKLEEQLRERDFSEAVRDLQLNDRQRKALRREWEQDGDGKTETIRSIAVDLGLAEPEFDEQAAEESAWRRADDIATGARVPGSGRVTPADVAGWPAAQRQRFRRDHPDQFEALKRGESIVLG